MQGSNFLSSQFGFYLKIDITCVLELHLSLVVKKVSHKVKLHTSVFEELNVPVFKYESQRNNSNNNLSYYNLMAKRK